MERQEEQALLWENCKTVFKQAKNSETDKLLDAIITLIKKYKDILVEVADCDFLNYVNNMESSDYISGTNGDDYELILHNYLKINKCNLDDIWRILSELVWDLSAMVSNHVCPSCKGDHLAYYTDKNNEHLYESCLGCFTTWENSKLIRRPEEIFPAPKNVLSNFQII